jgi:hypothetical protein
MSVDTPVKVLLADRDSVGRSAIAASLAELGYVIVHATNGAEALRGLYAERPDVVLMHTDLPIFDGWQVLSRIRELSGIPVLLIGTPDGSNDAVQALHQGADDYVLSGCADTEVVARVESLVRRLHGAHRSTLLMSLGDAHMMVDLEARTVCIDGTEISVTPIEFRLLTTFMRHPDQILSHDQLLRHAWDDQTKVGPERVKFAVARLRRKLTADGSADPISAVRGFGYRYHPLTA